MATQTTGSKSSGAKAKAKAPASEKNQAQAIAERAVDLPVGAVLTAADRVAELVEPFSGRSSVEKQLKSYRTQARRQVKRTERRGATARRRATTEARKTRNEIEQRVRKAVDRLPV